MSKELQRLIHSTLLITFLKVHLHHSSQIKSHKEITKQWKSRVFLLFLLDDGRIRLRIQIRTNNEGSGIPLIPLIEDQIPLIEVLLSKRKKFERLKML